MAKINTGTITADGSGNWSSNAIYLGSGAKRTYMRVNGVEQLYRDFTLEAGPQLDSAPTGFSAYRNAATDPATASNGYVSTQGTNRLIIAAVQYKDKASGYITPSSSNLTWNRGPYVTAGTSPYYSSAEIWWAWAATQLTNEAVTFTRTGGTAFCTVGAQLTAWANAANPTSLTANVNYGTAAETHTGNATTTDLALTTIATSNSRVVISGCYYTGTATMTNDAALTTILFPAQGTEGMYCVRSGLLTAGAKTWTQVTSPQSNQWHTLAGFEILPAA
jgi:hypothetical protein